jgi:tetratricopeptide (TPR) repeat protein
MILEAAPESERRFLRAGLPWLLAAVALALYLATLNHWVTLSSLEVTARVKGWEWRPILSQPVLFLLTWPCRWLPATMIPLALNLLSAACASLTLALLARSVALLPQDRPEQQRLGVQNERTLLSLPNAWVPMVLAAAALGLQLGFWENATAASGEMLDLLLFAYVIRCLLEYRIEQRQRWLDRAALVCGVGMANSWTMVAFLPLFLVAVLWIRPLSVLTRRIFWRIEQSGWEPAKVALAADLRFLSRMTLWALAGLSLFLVLPLAQLFSPDFSVGFWQALRTAAVSHKTILLSLARAFFRYHRDVALLLAAVYLLPVLMLGIRWRPLTSAEKFIRFDLISFILYLAHGFLLLICVWVAFDPPFSPRQISRQLGFSFSFLPLYCLGALSIGYSSGFFLLTASGYASRRRILRRALGRALSVLIYVLFGLTLTGLFLKNLPALRANNGPLLDQYAKWVSGSLPPEGGVVLSEDPMRLAVLQAALARETNAGPYMLVELPALPLRGYLAYLGRKHRGQWPELDAGAKRADAGHSAPSTSGLRSPVERLQLITRLAQNHRIFYLEPGFGILLERFYLQPHGMVYELKPYLTNSISGSPLTTAEFAGNEGFWQRAIKTGLRPILRLVAQPDLPQPGLESRLMEMGHLQMPPPPPAKALARWYSAALNYWGVTLQRHGRLLQATPCFDTALQLNPDNLPARLNLQCNSNLLAGAGMTMVHSRSLQDQISPYRNWSQVLAMNGPVDEPSYCFQLARVYAEAGFFRQACQQLERVITLVPDDLPACVNLGAFLNRCDLPDQALQIAARIQADPNRRFLGPGAEAEFAFLQAEAWLAKTNYAQAEEILRTLLTSRSRDAALLGRAAALFMSYHSYANALPLVDRQLQLAPDDLSALIHKGALSIQAGHFSNAIPPLTRALSLSNAYPARLSRAFAYFRSDQLHEAEADYQELLKVFPTDRQAWMGLAEIACQRGDTNAAIGYYQRCLPQVTPGTEEARVVTARLKTLKQGLP